MAHPRNLPSFAPVGGVPASPTAHDLNEIGALQDGLS